MLRMCKCSHSESLHLLRIGIQFALLYKLQNPYKLLSMTEKDFVHAHDMIQVIKTQLPVTSPCASIHVYVCVCVCMYVSV